MSTDVERLRIHFFYCVSILTLVLILTATDRWSEKSNFTVYLTNAATMTSLVLALVAIFYSFIANNGLSQSLGNISMVSQDVRESKDQISKYLDLTTSSANTAKENTEAIQAVSRQVHSTLQTLETALGAIKSQTESLRDTVTALPTRLDLLENKVLDATKSLVGGKATVATSRPSRRVPVANEVAQLFLDQSSLASNLLTYAAVRAFQTDKQLALPEFAKAINVAAANFFTGFLNCMDAVDLVDLKATGSSQAYEITGAHDFIVDNVRTYFVSYVESAFRTKAEQKAEWLDKLKNVELLFEAQPPGAPAEQSS